METPRFGSPRFPSSKFAVPRVASGLVRRSRLLDQLDRGEQARLSLVIGSPGAGKTTLLADWLTTHPERCSAWLNCEAADAEPGRFFAAVVEAVRRSVGQPGLGDDARQLLDVEGHVSADVVAALADDLERFGKPQVLIIDDLHLTGHAGAEVMRLLVDYQPTTLQVVAATRQDPPLRLHRMRINEELIEVRDLDLAFSAEETKMFLSGFGIQLHDEDLEMVNKRNEGWVAGLQMAAISIQDGSEGSEFAPRLELNGRTVAGYFLDEVLSRQPPSVAGFMLATSVLDELSESSCTAVSGPGSGALLEQMYRDQLFLTKTDNDAGTYRYHHLIQEVLRAELHARDPAAERLYHERAGRHFANEGRIGLAARHLVAAGRPPAAFQLLSEQPGVRYTLTPMRTAAYDRDDCPPELFAGSPEILLPQATELLYRGAFERGSRALALAEQCVGIEDQPEFAVQLGYVRTMRAGFVGELEEALTHLSSARSIGKGNERLDTWLEGLDALELYCHAFLGAYASAEQAARTLGMGRTIGPSAAQVFCPSVLSQAALAEGELAEAERLAREALSAAIHLGYDEHYHTFYAKRTMALLALERRDLSTAGRLTEQILSTLVVGRPIFDFLAQVDRARTWAAGGMLDEALDSLPAARASLRSERSPLLAQADELEIRLRLGTGDAIGAQSVAQRLPPERHIVLSATLALAAGEWKRAATFLADAPTDGPTIRSDLELRLLRAGVARMQDSPDASRLLRRALSLVDEHGYLQTALETAPTIVDDLISESVGYPISATIRSLIAARIENRQANAPRMRTNALPDPLTEAELRVLGKLAEGLSYADIAEELYLSLNTVKTHLRRSYMKLGVTSRSAAINRAASLRLI
jgi:LuxR family transcriptional regulator, maltose regulon positive regulatory protein